ncbi:TPA: hypothetical protein U1312_002038, partial [Streptococcus suis]|nr:hypothetical protein [Streptococcus suis]
MGRNKIEGNTRTRKRTHRWANLHIVVVLSLFICLLIGYKHFSLLRDGYMPLNTVLEKQSFKKISDGQYEKKIGDLSYSLLIDTDKNSVTKAGYQFDISNDIQYF